MTLARRVADRYKLAREHYRTNVRKLVPYTRGLPKEPIDEEDWQTVRDFGFFEFSRYELVPMRLIRPEKVWDPRKLPPLRARIEQNKPLDPIDLAFNGGRYDITNGIHRYALSQEFGFEYIPARVLYRIEFDAPARPEPPDVRPGTFVKLQEPDVGTDGVKREYGWVVEKFGPTRVSVQPVAEGDDDLEWPLDVSTSFLTLADPPPRWLVQQRRALVVRVASQLKLAGENPKSLKKVDLEYGPDAVKATWQGDFPKTTPCCACGKPATLVYAYREQDGELARDMHENHEDGKFWFHDAAAFATYICRDFDCATATTLWNQA